MESMLFNEVRIVEGVEWKELNGRLEWNQFNSFMEISAKSPSRAKICSAVNPIRRRTLSGLSVCSHGGVFSAMQ